MAGYILNRQPVANLNKVIEFDLEGTRMKRTLVMIAMHPDEISVASPVGNQLANAKPGQALSITVKGEERCLLGSVLAVDGVSMAVDMKE